MSDQFLLFIMVLEWYFVCCDGISVKKEFHIITAQSRITVNFPVVFLNRKEEEKEESDGT